MRRRSREAIAIDGYIRVSRVGKRRGERFISPRVQREQIETWATGTHKRLLWVFEELDESGVRADRPLLHEALERIETGVSRGLAVSRVNRVGRSLIDGLMQVDRVRAAGGELYSVLDGLDTSTSAGRLVLRIMLSMAEMEIDRIRDDWDAAHERAIKRGAYIGAYVPPGYVKTRSGRLRVDERFAPVIAEAFRRRAAGETLRSVADYVQSERLLTGKGNPGWTNTSITALLTNPVYLGELHHDRWSHEHAHPPLIDTPTFVAAQRPRPLARARGPDRLLLTGLVRCASCSMSMGGANVRDGRDGATRRLYACRRYYSGGKCAAPATITTLLLEPFVIDVFFRMLSRRRLAPVGALREATEQVARRQHELARYRDNARLLDVLGEDAFAEGLRTRKQRLHSARIDQAAAQARMDAHGLPRLAELRASWPQLDTLERRMIMSKVIDCVFVAPGNGHVENRVTICPRGTAPARLSRPGDKGNRLTAIKPRAHWINPKSGPTGYRPHPTPWLSRGRPDLRPPMPDALPTDRRREGAARTDTDTTGTLDGRRQTGHAGRVEAR